MKFTKAPKDPMGGHVRLYWSMLDSHAWRALSHADVRVFLAMRRKLKRSNNGDINATLSEMRHAGISSSSTLSAALHRLEALGFIEKTRQGGIAAGGKRCSLYRFTDQVTFDIPKVGVIATQATNEWGRFQTIAAAREAVKAFAPKKNTKVRLSNRNASTIESERPKSGSIVERVMPLPVRPSKLVKVGATAREAA